MSDSQHDLAHEFPEFKEAIHELKVSNNHFKKLFDEYHELNKSIHRSEIREDLLSDNEEEILRKKRLVIKDEIYSMLQDATK
jgi:uncharacterized protein YdcH (DUF465 family)